MSEWLARFARAPRRPQTWLNLLYLLAAFPLGLAYFVVLVVGLSVGAALAVVIIGLAILLATLAATRGMAAIERGTARALLGVPIAQPVDRRDLRPLQRIGRWLRDPVTWKSLIFVALKFPLGVVTFALVAAHRLRVARVPVRAADRPRHAGDGVRLDRRRRRSRRSR